MTDKIIVVTAPDDIQLDGLRILLVDLRPEQTQLISEALSKLESIPTIITYIWKISDGTEWLLDKKHKADLIIFNAEGNDDVIIGYMAAQANSHYFGYLKSVTSANRSAIYSVDQIYNILEKSIKQYETQ